MIFGQEVIALLGVSRYNAPFDELVNPATISSGIERIEIITGGKVLFGDEFYGRGAIFRHLEGERTVHVSVPGKPYRCLSLRFALNEAEQRRDYPRLTFWQGKSGLDEFVRDCVEGFHSPKTSLAALGAYVYSTINWHSSRSPVENDGNLVPDGVRRALEYLDGHTESWIPVEPLAKIADLSKPYFQFLFKKHVGTTPHQYHLSARIGQACEKLAYGGKSVKSISDECGFDNLETFYRAFSRITGHTPARYRRKHSALFWDGK